jgi:DnaK suppressor protein
MFVSILQLMGMALGKPIQSRAESAEPANSDAKPSPRGKKGSSRPGKGATTRTTPAVADAGEGSANDRVLRRQSVKTPTVPTKKTAPPVTRGVAPVRAPAQAPTSPLAAPAKATKASVKVAPVPVMPVAAAPAAVAKKKPAAAPAKALTAPLPAPAPVAAPAVRASSRKSAPAATPAPAPAVASTAAKASYSPAMPSIAHPTPIFTAPRKDPALLNNWKSKTADQLSDAEVLAMPDAEYMSDLQLAFFRLKLSQLKQDILNNAGETTEHLREDTVVVPDPADRATIEEEHALELRTRDRERKLLKKIEQSISRIDSGDYGYCDETGEPIGVGRLLARPTATLSLEAQQRRELKQKMFGD